MNKTTDSKSITKNYFNKIACEYNESSEGKFVISMYDEIIHRIIQANPDKMLDLGCGNGNILKIINKMLSTDLYGIDISKNMIREARKNLGTNVKLTVGDAENLPYNDEEFSVVLCNASFHHFPNPDIVLSEIKRVLKKDGILILGDKTGPFDLYTKIINKFLKYTKTGDYKFYNKKEIISLIESSGFVVDDFLKINNNFFALNAIK
ncbi:MAG: class I SAM-dependent methyltransferase [Clostridium sp.]